MKKDKIIFWSVVVLGTGVAAWFLGLNKVFTKSSSRTQQDYINNIVNKIGADSKILSTYDTGYLQAWSNAIDVNSSSFTYNSKNYDTATGTAK
jgi:hypothetical protein